MEVRRRSRFMCNQWKCRSLSVWRCEEVGKRNMDWSWTLLICLGFGFLSVPVSTQDPSRTLFLISGPEVSHAGTPTSLAVTVLTDFSGMVTAELTHGNITVTQTVDYEGGLTRILTLPPISGDISQNAILYLTVRGSNGDGVIFSNTTTVKYNARTVTNFIQTDRSRYQQGDTVRVRIVSVQLDNLPYNGMMDIIVQDPGRNIVKSWESVGTPGIVLQEFGLYQTAPVGQWTVTTTINGLTDEKHFTVEHHDDSMFEVMVNTQSQILVEDSLTGSVRALYRSGPPVRGILTVTVDLAPGMDNEASVNELTLTKEIYGLTQFSFSRDQLKALQISSEISGDIRLNVVATVTSNFTGEQFTKTVEVHLLQHKYYLRFHGYPHSLRPSSTFFTRLKISRYDKKPLSSEDMTQLVRVEVNQVSTMNSETTSLTYTMPQDGDVQVRFRLQDQVEILYIRAVFQSREETLRIESDVVSPSGSYIWIIPDVFGVVEEPLEIRVESTFEPSTLHYVVSSKGQLLAAGTENSLSFTVTPALSWYPEACITVYSILSDGEVTRDAAHIQIAQPNQISLSWSTYDAQPGEQISLTVTTVEPGSTVSIIVMGMQDDNTLDYSSLQETQDCCAWMLTNSARMQKPCDGPVNGNVLAVEKYWSHWMGATDSWLWLDTVDSTTMWNTDEITVPDIVSYLGAVALVMSDDLGLGFTPWPIQVTVSKDFSLSLNVPSYLIRGEEIVLEVNIVNYLDRELEIIVLLAQSKAFEFVLGAPGDVSVVNAQKVTTGRQASAMARFPIRPIVLGEIEISVDAICAEVSDSLVWKVLVKPEGIEKSYSETLFLELANNEDSFVRYFSFSFPPDVVLGSQRTYMALAGDLLSFSLKNLGSLLQLPTGCGEQNMIFLAPSVYVLHYLEFSNQNDEGIRQEALGYMTHGYQRQLLFQREDGSFSAFGNRDASGSTWLTAFVVRTFVQAQTYMQIDHSVLASAATWLLAQQGPDGDFPEVGSVIHTEMMGGLDDGSVGLTAYVLIALLEDGYFANLYPDAVSKAKSYLEISISGGNMSSLAVSGISNYSLSLVTYALTISFSTESLVAYDALWGRADVDIDGVRTWSTSAGLHSNEWQTFSAQIEVGAYVLLTLYIKGNFVEGVKLLKWLLSQQNHRGSFGSTQDTVMALKALANFAAFSGANAINLTGTISIPESSFLHTFAINPSNYRVSQTVELDNYDTTPIILNAEGRGFGLFQINSFYSIRPQTHDSDNEALSLSIEVSEEDDNYLLLYICMSLKEDQLISQTGMAILEVGQLSGFIMSPESPGLTDPIKEVEMTLEKVILYLESLTKSEVCISLLFMRKYNVARVQDAVVQLYDYYEPRRRAVRTYNTDSLHNLHPCDFCGEYCELCMPGITIAVTPPPFSGSVNSATSSVICIFVGVAVYLLMSDFVK